MKMNSDRRILESRGREGQENEHSSNFYSITSTTKDVSRSVSGVSQGTCPAVQTTSSVAVFAN